MNGNNALLPNAPSHKLIITEDTIPLNAKNVRVCSVISSRLPPHLERNNLTTAQSDTPIQTIFDNKLSIQQNIKASSEAIAEKCSKLKKLSLGQQTFQRKVCKMAVTALQFSCIISVLTSIDCDPPIMTEFVEISNSTEDLTDGQTEWFMSRRTDFCQTSGALIQLHGTQTYFTSSLTFETLSHIDSSCLWFFKSAHSLSGHSMWYRLNGYGEDDVDVWGLFQVGYNAQNDIFAFKSPGGLHLSVSADGYGFTFKYVRSDEPPEESDWFRVIGDKKFDLIDHSYAITFW